MRKRKRAKLTRRSVDYQYIPLSKSIAIERYHDNVWGAVVDKRTSLNYDGRTVKMPLRTKKEALLAALEIATENNDTRAIFTITAMLHP